MIAVYLFVQVMSLLLKVISKYCCLFSCTSIAGCDDQHFAVCTCLSSDQFFLCSRTVQLQQPLDRLIGGTSISSMMCKKKMDCMLPTR